MTETSFEALRSFIIKFQSEFTDKTRVADYGGTDSVCENQVKNLLASGNIKDYHMLDFDNGIDLRKPIKGKKFGLGICMDLLEHTSDPKLVAKNIMNSLKPGALLYVTAPFVWALHAYPDDFWRFTPHGITELFKGMEILTVYAVHDGFKLSEEDKINVKALLPVSEPYSRIIGLFRKK